MADDLTEFDAWFGRIIAGMEPGQRARAAFKLGQALRQANLARIAGNVDPDGTPFEPRKHRKDRRGRLRRRGLMFKGLRRARNWRIIADAEGVEVRPSSSGADRVGAVSQFGEVDTVGRARDGRTIRVRYPERRLLGFSAEDRQLAIDIAGEMLDPDSR
ncbi:phage virion morphogenesis protein [Sphingomonas psychrotolerans]|uniref:Phage virion morphogenesis protein n=1 Tax=Sphingomonas psychrotolerans TaxID=1327635 RepID=A0ABU3N101_9SPHN|nr:phage virion morphogenesis protein [Sphingomonas psychrotolerans]MDT8758233.1 phage virion morphogenesis protein [Sphingomonas psychrotolerans]